MKKTLTSLVGIVALGLTGCREGPTHLIYNGSIGQYSNLVVQSEVYDRTPNLYLGYWIGTNLVHIKGEVPYSNGKYDHLNFRLIRAHFNGEEQSNQLVHDNGGKLQKDIRLLLGQVYESNKITAATMSVSTK